MPAIVLNEPVDEGDKGFPAVAGVTVGTVGGQGWRALDGDFSMPLLVLRDSAVEHNLATMADYCRRTGVDLAPHGKTHMSPQLWARQRAAGAWAVTVATVSQARLFIRHGATRIVLANEVGDAHDARWLRRAVDDGVEAYALVDSAAGLELLGEAFAGSGRRLGILVELGYPGGRAGTRSAEDALRIARRVAATPGLRLAGVEGFEGVMPGAELAEQRERIAEYLDVAATVLETMLAESLIARGPAIASFGGSSHFHLVAARFAGHAGVRVLLRSGCYLAHDHGLYARSTPLDGRAGRPALLPALELWARVLSRPEPTLAIVGFGRRDAPYDSGLPTLLGVRRRGSIRAAGGVVRGLNDQHAYLDVPADSDLAVGDLLCFGVSHPCTAFDRWRLIPVVSDDYRVVDAVRTYF
ncbi:MAG: alanine racemase [Microbacteriaceae bacterium]